jgi:hypothetical protein
VADEAGVADSELSAAAVPIVRRLIEQGFLLPATGDTPASAG